MSIDRTQIKFAWSFTSTVLHKEIPKPESLITVAVKPAFWAFPTAYPEATELGKQSLTPVLFLHLDHQGSGPVAELLGSRTLLKFPALVLEDTEAQPGGSQGHLIPKWPSWSWLGLFPSSLQQRAGPTPQSRSWACPLAWMSFQFPSRRPSATQPIQ